MSWPGASSDRPSWAPGARSAKKRKFSAAAQRRLRHVADRLAGVHALDQRDLVGARLDGIGDPVQDSLPLGSPACRVQPGNARLAARAARSISAAPPRATVASTALSTGDSVSNVRPSPASGVPSIRCATGRSRKRARCAVGLRDVLVERRAHARPRARRARAGRCASRGNSGSISWTSIVSARGRAANAGASVVFACSISAAQQHLLLGRGAALAQARHDVHERVVAAVVAQLVEVAPRQPGAHRRPAPRRRSRAPPRATRRSSRCGGTSASMFAEYSTIRCGMEPAPGISRVHPAALTLRGRNFNMLNITRTVAPASARRATLSPRATPPSYGSHEMPLPLDRLKGSMPPIITPFKGGEVDYDTYARLVEFQIREGSHGDSGERHHVRAGGAHDRGAQQARRHRDRGRRNGRVPVVAATGSQSLWETTPPHRARGAGRRRCAAHRHALLHPSANSAAWCEYYLEVMRGIDTPWMIYHIPGRTAVSVTLDTRQGTEGPVAALRRDEARGRTISDFVTDCLTAVGSGLPHLRRPRGAVVPDDGGRRVRPDERGRQPAARGCSRRCARPCGAATSRPRRSCTAELHETEQGGLLRDQSDPDQVHGEAPRHHRRQRAPPADGRRRRRSCERGSTGVLDARACCPLNGSRMRLLSYAAGAAERPSARCRTAASSSSAGRTRFARLVELLASRRAGRRRTRGGRPRPDLALDEVALPAAGA